MGRRPTAGHWPLEPSIGVQIPAPQPCKVKLMNDPIVQNDPALQVMSRCGEIQVIVDHLQQAQRAAVDRADTYIRVLAQARLEMEKMLRALETMESGSEEIKTKLNQPIIRQGNNMISVLQCLKDELKEIMPFTDFGQKD